MFHIDGKVAKPIEATTFRDLNMSEMDIEEIIKENSSLITADDSLLIVGQQVRNASNAISDLIGINQNGDIVLIEIKRDVQDITARREAFEFQAIRYAASLARLDDIDALLHQIYVPYLEKNATELTDGLTIIEQARRNILNFFRDNEIVQEDFNEKQQIILVASDFDEQTRSAVAWLNQNGVDIHCYKLIPYVINEELYIDSERILPLDDYEDYFIHPSSQSTESQLKRKRGQPRRNPPRIDAMLRWGVVQAGDQLKVKNHEDTATLLANSNVKVDDEEKSLHQWLKEVTGWSSVQTYAMTIHVKTNQPLSELRSEYMAKHSL